MATQAQIARHSRLVERSPVFYGWVIWAIATLGLIGSVPGQAFTASIFIDHYIVEFGIDRTTVSGLFGLGTFIAALGLTWMGKRVDQYGSRAVGMMVGAIFAVVLVLVSLITGPLTMLLSFIAIRMLGQGSMVLVSMNAIAQWWRFRRGWVVGLAFVFFALFQTVYLRLLQDSIAAFGWRTTWVILGVVVGAFIVPLWWLLMRDRPEDYGLLPDATVAAKSGVGETSVDAVPAEDNWTLSEARRVPIFWVFVCGRMLAAAWGTGLIFHQVSIFAEVGHPEVAVAQTYGLLALVNAGATLGIGRIINRIRPGLVMATQLILMMSVIWWSMIMSEAWMLTVYAVVFGVVFALGANFDGSVWADLFGRRYHGSIRGLVTTMLVTGSSIGPMLFGFSYDHLGGYGPILYIGMALLFVQMLAALSMTRPRPRPETA
jgi:MFS family permease